MASAETLAARDFEAMMAQADLIIGHAGIGTILGALQLGKPVAIMAREARYGEHRNDHQLATLERFTNVPGVTAISSADDLTACIKALEDGDGQVETPARLPEGADPGLLQMVAEFVDVSGQKP
ncbi:MAG: hypothetical protein KI792_04790 [Alphaproteobacteria bacterium]|nr:hypothetical protein [Alphaproteobacteria bacterium SS10]